MTQRLHLSYVAATMLIAPLALSQPALAQQQQGVTSGPAVGTAVVPNTTAANAGHSGAATPQQGASAGGAPGVAAKPGSEGGTSPGPGSGKRP